MTRPEFHDWDTNVLDNPVVINVPDPVPADAEPLVIGAGQAVAAHRSGDRARAALWLALLAHAGAVAIHTDDTTYAIRETLDAWTLVGIRHPDPAALAATARQRARRLAAERRAPADHDPGGQR